MIIYEQVTNGSHPDESGYYDTDMGRVFYSSERGGWFGSADESNNQLMEPINDIVYWFHKINSFK